MDKRRAIKGNNKETEGASGNGESVKDGVEALRIKLAKEQAEIQRYNLMGSGPEKVFKSDGK